MCRVLRIVAWLLLAALLASPALFAQRGLSDAPPTPVVVWNAPFFGGYGGFGGFGPFGGFGGYGFSHFGYPIPPAPFTYAPPYWWVGPYSLADPRQDGYNPSAGYEWDSVGALILTVLPARARVTLDGVFVGTADRLGPFQLPAGQHTLRVEASGYEPSDTVVKVEQPGPLFLDI